MSCGTLHTVCTYVPPYFLNEVRSTRAACTALSLITQSLPSVPSRHSPLGITRQQPTTFSFTFLGAGSGTPTCADVVNVRLRDRETWKKAGAERSIVHRLTVLPSFLPSFSNFQQPLAAHIVQKRYAQSTTFTAFGLQNWPLCEHKIKIDCNCKCSAYIVR